MFERREVGEQFSVKGRVFPLSIRQLLGEESQGDPGTIQKLLHNRTHMRVRGIKCKRDLITRGRVHKLRSRGEEILGTAEGGVQSQRLG